ncbi:3-phosphoshikimate 1-carboxyvinyltransferase [Methanosarcina thermophila]|jgi:3-phosphoshikimate 1-carboxyvinyltransferase|uniref:3-phosphoshikimate 1-carboxyvinyltransferase n=3 Tax=Methanosarcina thermophila TaxID=2210 RepID=A0A1I6X3R8_METTE|nr:3-phosphoshikimate 1-carboxyvinyltransferase [Methanosarcina thermophila]ALK04708.1 MAG: 3-phosphoshikimate 1-carboxyvinyltransferase [Methanosarcina sp. 795]AKB13404.1 5-Enolpyruvylshikimate-3-phosphate synthase [Methanosarcina thermophila TM-1]AKB15961.1 5-Enolpyruvylshikimate-3-phosphate synthase [Methanosarcina thermophila CHTI-55]NLU57456.1 3-phosphoshikimate 1-carboxyvinyltransferase [Methanosarcina thermophila]SFT32812.1 3-phosphoshikimate 1-carboxyvinyltransferase [Methanosarcina th
MRVSIDKSSIKGEVFAPSSKSYTHRAITLAALSKESIVRRPLISADTLATIRASELFGALIERMEDKLIIHGNNGKPKVPDDVINAANSGTTLRFMTAVAALTEGTTVLTGDASLRTRPNGPLLEALNKLGVKACSTRGNERAPLVVKGGIKGQEVSIDGTISSQFISALLIICPLAENSTTLSIKGQLKSRPYIDITLEMLELAGAKIHTDESNGIRFIIPGKQKYDLKDYIVPGDFSSASYLLAAAAMVGESEVTVKNLFPSRQGDEVIIETLRQMGADIVWDKEAGNVTVRGGRKLKAITFDAGATPDLVPTIAVLAAVAEGTSRIENAEHVRYKETDRLRALATELPKLGVDLKEERDSLTITGGKLKGAQVHGWDDHRIVMALTLAGMVAGNTTIDTTESVSISYPDFFKDMRGLGARIKDISEE